MKNRVVIGIFCALVWGGLGQLGINGAQLKNEREVFTKGIDYSYYYEHSD